jgi:hypothetical protein
LQASAATFKTLLSHRGAQLVEQLAKQLQGLEVDVVGGDVAYRSSLRKTLTTTTAFAAELLSNERGYGWLFNAMVVGAYKCLGVINGLLPLRHTSFLAHVSAVEFWDQHMGAVTHCSMDELRKGITSGLPKEVATLWALKISTEGSAVTDKEFGAMTDLVGVVGGLAKASNQVPYILSEEGWQSRTLLISSTWDDDMRSGKPLRIAVECFGRVNKWCESDTVGSMLIEMEDDGGAQALLRKDLHGKDAQGSVGFGRGDVVGWCRGKGFQQCAGCAARCKFSDMSDLACCAFLMPAPPFF